MGTIIHNAIVVTHDEEIELLDIREKADAMGLMTIGLSEKGWNGYRTITICPSGSKVGWPEAVDYAVKMNEFVEYLRQMQEDSYDLHWVQVQYGEVELDPRIVAHHLE